MRGFATERRQETLVWLVQAFDVMHFQDSLLFDVVLLLDRYYACEALLHGGEPHGGESQRKLLAAVYIALKTGSSMDTQVSLKQLVAHDLGKDQIPFEDILDAELSILQKLRFRVGTPSAHDFLETLDTRLKHEYASDACLNLADFLLQLSLSDASLHYKYSHAILAASALALALYATQAPSSAFVALVEDLSLHCPAMPVPHAEMVECCDALHQLWILGVSVHEQYTFTRYLWAKFSRSGRSSAAHIAPPHRPSRSLLPSPAWAAPAVHQGCGGPERGYPAQQPCAPPRRGKAGSLPAAAERLGLAQPPSAVPAPWASGASAPRTQHHRGGA